MKVKYYLLSMAAIGLLTACSGEKKEASTETGKATTEKKVEADQPTGDVFIYTSEHRHDKVQPDKAKVLSFTTNTNLQKSYKNDDPVQIPVQFFVRFS